MKGGARQGQFGISLSFFNLLQWNLKMFTICELFPADHVKAEKKYEFRWLFPRYLQFCVFFLYLKFGPINIFYRQALGRAQICLTV